MCNLSAGDHSNNVMTLRDLGEHVLVHIICLKDYLTLDKSAIIFTWTLITLSSTSISFSSPDFNVKVKS